MNQRGLGVPITQTQSVWVTAPTRTAARGAQPAPHVLSCPRPCVPAVWRRAEKSTEPRACPSISRAQHRPLWTAACRWGPAFPSTPDMSPHQQHMSSFKVPPRCHGPSARDSVTRSLRTGCSSRRSEHISAPHGELGGHAGMQHPPPRTPAPSPPDAAAAKADLSAPDESWISLYGSVSGGTSP